MKNNSVVEKEEKALVQYVKKMQRIGHSNYFHTIQIKNSCDYTRKVL
jgi:hypothetical protein